MVKPHYGMFNARRGRGRDTGMRWPTQAPVISISLFFRWYDLWIGAYIDTERSTIYICPVPMFGVKVHWRMEDV